MKLDIYKIKNPISLLYVLGAGQIYGDKVDVGSGFGGEGIGE